nr:MAG TPA: hypothetical protein [Caudoviricetes sp.]
MTERDRNKNKEGGPKIIEPLLQFTVYYLWIATIASRMYMIFCTKIGHGYRV